MPLRDVYDRTFDERVLHSQSDEEHAVEEEQSDNREIHDADEVDSSREMEVTQ